jgi:WD40-like Beta Propeller Repeat
VTLGEAQHVVRAADAAADAGADFRLPQIGEPRLVAGIGSDSKDDNPTLTADLLEIYFSSTRGGSSDVWVSKRDDVGSDFGEPEPVTVVNTEEFESSPAVDLDGLTLWVGRKLDDGLGGVDIYVSHRDTREGAWSDPELVTELSTELDDIPRPPGAGGLIMPLASRAESDDYQTYLATREQVTAAFGAPVALTDLWREGTSSVDGYLTWDGRYLFLTYTQDELGDLFISPRDGDTFREAIALDSVNTADDERDPWISPDGTMLYFASDREDGLRIYQAPIEW